MLDSVGLRVECMLSLFGVALHTDLTTTTSVGVAFDVAYHSGVQQASSLSDMG